MGQTVEFVDAGRRGVTAYHPSVDNHELRIPEGAKPFNSETMGSGGTFKWTFEVEGTYDYYSRAYEYLGMVGRIIVGKPGGGVESELQDTAIATAERSCTGMPGAFLSI